MEYARGVRVRHKKRGLGLVMGRTPDGRVRITFDNGESHRYTAEQLKHKVTAAPEDAPPPPCTVRAGPARTDSQQLREATARKQHARKMREKARDGFAIVRVLGGKDLQHVEKAVFSCLSQRRHGIVELAPRGGGAEKKFVSAFAFIRRVCWRRTPTA